MNTKIIAGVVAVVLIVGSFYAGMTYAKSSSPRGQFAAGAMFTRGMGMTGAGSVRGAGGFAQGQILSKDAGSITLKMQDGSTKIVLIATSTAVMKSSSGTLDDLSEGTNVLVTGGTNSDGSITAQSIQIRPAGTTAPMMIGGRVQTQ